MCYSQFKMATRMALTQIALAGFAFLALVNVTSSADDYTRRQLDGRESE